MLENFHIHWFELNYTATREMLYMINKAAALQNNIDIKTTYCQSIISSMGNNIPGRCDEQHCTVKIIEPENVNRFFYYFIFKDVPMSVWSLIEFTLCSKFQFIFLHWSWLAFSSRFLNIFELTNRGNESLCMRIYICCCASSNVVGLGSVMFRFTTSLVRESKLTCKIKGYKRNRVLTPEPHKKPYRIVFETLE